LLLGKGFGDDLSDGRVKGLETMFYSKKENQNPKLTKQKTTKKKQNTKKSPKKEQEFVIQFKGVSCAALYRRPDRRLRLFLLVSKSLVAVHGKTCISEQWEP